MEAKSERAILMEAIKARGAYQKDIAKEMGMLQSGLSGNINRIRMSMDTFKGVLDVLGYDVVVVDRKTGKKVWTVEV